MVVERGYTNLHLAVEVTNHLEDEVMKVFGM